MKLSFSKKLIFLFLLITSFITYGCKKLSIDKELRIDMTSQFQNDLVTIKLDKDVVFSDTVRTSSTLGVAKIIKLDYPIGKYEISVNVNGVEQTDKFRHKHGRYINISYNRTSAAISITYPDELNTYD